MSEQDTGTDFDPTPGTDEAGEVEASEVATDEAAPVAEAEQL